MQSAAPDLTVEFGGEDSQGAEAIEESSSYSFGIYFNCCLASNGTNIAAECEGVPCQKIYTIDRLEKGTEFILMFFFFFGLVLSLIGNVSVMSVLTCGRRKRRRSFNIFLLNLALADWTLGILCMPFLFTQIIIFEWIFGLGMCKFVPFANKVSQIVSIFTLTAIGIDRYCAVMYPLRPRMDNRKKKITVVITWVLAVAISAPKLFVLQTTGYLVDINGAMAYGCGEYWPGQLDGEVYEWSLFCLTFVLPFLLLSFCYGRVARKLWTRNLPGNADPERDQEQAKNKRKTVRMLISVVVLFAICWLPMHSYNILMNFHPSLFEEKPMSTRIFRASVYIWLTMTDTIVNPIVYVFLSDRFRKDLKLMFIRSVRRCLPGRHGADGFSDYRSQYTTSMMETSPRTTRRTRLSPILAVVGRQGSNNSLTSKTASNGNFLTVAPYNDCLKRRGDAKIENAISEEDEKIDASKF